ncbi:hypothetical protein RF11_05748 [Thelohanellus kitauei]|uniref:Uncharacterized protein n=1 Tax=Thelohanellus kitauei TaxID=669202 RepID=A0A0C2JXQ4_THEKT|nr:hypothetical protein RF11_05748 [Thelohanellus kitauei]
MTIKENSLHDEANITETVADLFNYYLQLCCYVVAEKPQPTDGPVMTKFDNQINVEIEEEIASIASNRTFMLKHFEHNPEFSSSNSCEHGFLVLTIIKLKARERLLTLEDELRVSVLSMALNSITLKKP